MPSILTPSVSAGQRFAERRQDEGADNRTEQRPHPADDGRQDHLDRAVGAEGCFGKQVVVVEGVPDTGDAGETERNRDRQHLVFEQMDTLASAAC